MKPFKAVLLFGLAVALYSSLSLAAGPNPQVTRPALTLTGTWSVEVAAPDPVNGIVWQVESTGKIAGGAFIQTRAYDAATIAGCTARKDGTGDCKRIRILADKPADKVASIAIQFPGRTFSITAPAGTPVAEIDLNEISLNDYGQASLMLNVTGATSQAFGLADIRTTDQDLTPAALAAVTADGTVLQSGDSVASGWRWLWFGSAKQLGIVDDPTNLLSLCGFYPDGKEDCSSDNTLSMYVTEKGTYLFVAWDTSLQSAVFAMTGA